MEEIIALGNDITLLDLIGKDLADGRIRYALNALSYPNCQVLGLDIGGAIIDEDVFNALPILLPDTRLTSLGVDNVDFFLPYGGEGNGFQGITPFVQALNNSNIQRLVIDDNDLSHEALMFFISQLPYMQLNSLSINYSGIDDQIVYALSLALIYSRLLKALELNGNGITDQGLGYLHQAISDHSLKELGLINVLSGNGANYLEYLMQNRFLGGCKYSQAQDHRLAVGEGGMEMYY